MIYTQEGVPVRIHAYCGKVKPKWAKTAIMLVRVVAVEDDTWRRFRYAVNLRADGGINEIEKEIDVAFQMVLCPRVLKEAMEEAD